MSGEWRITGVGLFALILICSIFIIASTACADGEVEGGDNSTVLLYSLNKNQSDNGSWDEDVNTTAIANLGNDVALDTTKGYARNEGEYKYIYDDDADSKSEDYEKNIIGGSKWIAENVEECTSVDYCSYTISVRNTGNSPDAYSVLQTESIITLAATQEPHGSWNYDVGDTAMAIYGLSPPKPENRETVIKGIEWLLEQENKQEHSWGSIEDDSKAIMALNSAGIDVWEEIAALMLRQRPDGSFGGIEDTSWAVIALSTSPNKDTMMSMERAVSWLRSQNYDNNKDLALAALAEQYYENAKLSEEREEEGNGFIPPPWMYALSFFIIGSLALGYWLFARLDRNEILDGVRKDIYAYITEHPGEHLANITKKFDLSSSSTRYHLSVLEGMDKIVSHKNGKYKRYYVNKNGYSKYTNGNGYKPIMSALKNGTARRIVKFLLSNPESNQKRVSKALRIHPSTVNWHAKRLRDAEIITKQKKGKEIVYSLNQEVQLSKVIGIIEGSIA
ncbi:MAG: winged helix-turn-helix transcriptional regulator [Thermoplasmata archaeon]|nr:MAG: winged helix-turn-helix transcriptional regulator [Thermoplasmata archaeon]